MPLFFSTDSWLAKPLMANPSASSLPSAGMPANQGGVFPVEDLQGPGHELGELVLDLVFQAVREW